MPFTHTFMGSNPVQVTKISEIPIEKQGFIFALYRYQKVSVKDFHTRTSELSVVSSKNVK